MGGRPRLRSPEGSKQWLVCQVLAWRASCARVYAYPCSALVPRSVRERRALLSGSSNFAPLVGLWLRYRRTHQQLDMASGASHEDDDEEERCRICFWGHADGPLVQPCACRGSAKWVHSACLEIWRRMGPREDAAYRCGQCNDKYRDALSRQLLRARLQAERTNYQASALTLNSFAFELWHQGHFDEAEPLCREALKGRRERLGNRHPNTRMSINALGVLLLTKGDLAAAESLCREALEG